jgi:hypothetical protein
MTTFDIAEVRGSLRRELLTVVRKHPGATSENIAAVLGKPHNHYTGTLRTMFDEGLLGRQRHGRAFRYFIPDRAPATTEQAEPTDGEFDFKLSATLDKVLIEDMRTDIAELEAEIDALEQWKADAIARHPDLAPVDPLMVKAREIALSGGWVDAFADEIIVGHFDSHPIVQAIYTTLLQEA